jgi:hypothetical protein
MDRIGALVGINYFPSFMNYVAGSISNCYSTSDVSPTVAGRCYLVGENRRGTVTRSFWETTDLSQGWPFDSGINWRKAEMQNIQTYLNADWDFVGETRNGTEDIWWMADGDDYPRLWWEPLPRHAFSPEPRGGAIDVVQPVILRWSSGASAVFHDLYFGDDQDVVSQATTEDSSVYRGRLAAETTSYELGDLEYGKAYYWRIDEISDTEPNSVCVGNVWSFVMRGSLVYVSPEDRSTTTVATLRWEAEPGGEYAYDVYFGNDRESVSSATTESKDIYRVRLPAWTTSYSPPEDLLPGTTYYWRIDAVDASDPLNIAKGNVWSFTMESRGSRR